MIISGRQLRNGVIKDSQSEQYYGRQVLLTERVYSYLIAWAYFSSQPGLLFFGLERPSLSTTHHSISVIKRLIIYHQDLTFPQSFATGMNAP